MNNASMERFEILKSTTIQYSLFELLHYKLSDFIVEEIYQTGNSFQNEQILTKKITSKEDLTKLQSFLELHRNELDINNLYDTCIEEFREIKSDFKWLNSKDGKLIIKIEYWIEEIRNKLHTRFKDCKIFVGRSLLEPKELVIGGILKNDLELKNIKKIIELENPPILPIYKFEFEN
jgi:Sec7-like guanine-nucleotide exchange factor